MRTPLRPLARVLDAREKGENPDVIEAEERAIRNVKVQMRMRRRAESRLLVLGIFFFAHFSLCFFRAWAPCKIYLAIPVPRATPLGWRKRRLPLELRLLTPGSCDLQVVP